MRDANGKLVEHRTLGIAEGAEIACDLLLFLDVNRVAGNAILTQRQVGDTHGSPLTIDGNAINAIKLAFGGKGITRKLCRRSTVARFQKLDLVFDHPFHALRTNRLDIGIVGKAQVHIGIADPHRRRRRGDKTAQCCEVRFCVRRL